MLLSEQGQIPLQIPVITPQSLKMVEGEWLLGMVRPTN